MDPQQNTSTIEKDDSGANPIAQIQGTEKEAEKKVATAEKAKEKKLAEARKSAEEKLQKEVESKRETAKGELRDYKKERISKYEQEIAEIKNEKASIATKAESNAKSTIAFIEEQFEKTIV